VQEAILEGRLQVAPRTEPVGSAADQQALIAIAKKARLTFVDPDDGQTYYDLEAAEAFRALARDQAQEIAAPIFHEKVVTKAQANLDQIESFMETEGLSAPAREVVRQHFNALLKSTPNAAKLLADEAIAEQHWFNALGRAASLGLVEMGKKKAPAAAAGAGADALTMGGRRQPIEARPVGRRAGGGGQLQLTPRVQQMYRENGMDPKTGVNPTTTAPLDLSKGLDLE
ncbi:MAG: hypothetical protein ABL982_00005, partial [Vicinamibacterales bacterium]